MLFEKKYSIILTEVIKMKNLQKFFNDGFKNLLKESSEFEKKFESTNKYLEEEEQSMKEWSKNRRIIRNKSQSAKR